MKWTPPWAPNVTGEYEETTEPIDIALSCSVCGDKSRTKCLQRMPRTQIARYSLLHMHGKDKEKWSNG